MQYDSGVHRGLVADGLDAAVAALAYSQRNRSVTMNCGMAFPYKKLRSPGSRCRRP